MKYLFFVLGLCGILVGGIYAQQGKRPEDLLKSAISNTLKQKAISFSGEAKASMEQNMGILFFRDRGVYEGDISGRIDAEGNLILKLEQGKTSYELYKTATGKVVQRILSGRKITRPDGLAQFGTDLRLLIDLEDIKEDLCDFNISAQERKYGGYTCMLVTCLVERELDQEEEDEIEGNELLRQALRGAQTGTTEIKARFWIDTQEHLIRCIQYKIITTMMTAVIQGVGQRVQDDEEEEKEEEDKWEQEEPLEAGEVRTTQRIELNLSYADVAKVEIPEELKERLK